MENKNIKYIMLGLIGIIVVIIIIMLCTNNKENLNYELNDGIYTIENAKYEETEEKTNLVKIDVKDYGIMIAELYPNIAPITVDNFQTLISEKFYDGLIFHRVINNFMIQTGDPLGNGTGGSSKNIKGEFSENGVKNDLSHERGVLSMARRGAVVEDDEIRNSASSQFFIVHTTYPSLDGKYASFGKLLHGYDVLDKIAVVNTDENDKPLKEVKMNSIRFVKEVD